MNKKLRFLKTTDRSDMFYWQTDRPFTEEETKKIFLDRHQNFDSKRAVAAIEWGMYKAGKSKANSKVAKLHNVIAFGSVNVVLKATLVDGTDIIIRIHPPQVINGYFWVEKLAAERAIKAGIPSYKTYFIDDSQERFNFDYIIIECLKGENIQNQWPLEKDREKKLIEETGYYLAKLHSIKTNNFGFFDNKKARKENKLVGIHKRWKDHVFAALVENLDYLTINKIFTKDDRNKIEKILTKKESLLVFNNPRLIQNDLADWNEMAFGDNITGFIDWDECYSGDPVADFSACIVFFPFE